MTTRDTFSSIRTTITSLVQGEVRSWGHVGKLLEQVEKSCYWQGEATSFSEWLRAFALRLRISESSLWRYLSSARYYQKLRQTLESQGVTCPQVEELPNSVSPENIELLAKLGRVAPEDILKDIATQVVRGSIRREKLRSAWEIYRPALAGRTSRGRNGVVPTVDRTNSKMLESAYEARLLNGITSSGTEWTGIENPYLYKIFLHVAPESKTQVRNIVNFDAIAVVSAKSNTETEFHGIEIRAPYLLGVGIFDRLESQRPYSHYIWVATNGGVDDLSNCHIPEYVGLLAVKESHVVVLRQAQRNPGELSGDLAMSLVRKALHR